MAKEKPTPIDRQTFLDNLKEPYNLPEHILQPYQQIKDNPKYRNPGKPNLVRGNEISMKGDESQNIKITLEDHDVSILHHIKHNIKPTVLINGVQREIPIIYGSPERWKSIQKDGLYRDKNGKAQIPLIVLKRNSFTKDTTIGNKLDGNKVNNIQYFKKGWSKRNVYDNFSVLQGQKKSEEYQVTIIPDYIKLNYSLLIYTDYVEHMNGIIESIEFASDSYWGDKEKFLFRTYIREYPTPIEVSYGNDRASKTTLSMDIMGYIIPESAKINLAKPSPKSFNVTKIRFEERTVNSLEDLRRNLTPQPPPIPTPDIIIFEFINGDLVYTGPPGVTVEIIDGELIILGYDGGTIEIINGELILN